MSQTQPEIVMKLFEKLLPSCVDAKLVGYAKVFWGHSKMSQHKSVRPTQMDRKQEVRGPINPITG